MIKKAICLLIACGLFVTGLCHATLDMKVYFAARDILVEAAKADGRYVKNPLEKRATALSKAIISGGMQTIADTIVFMQAAGTMQRHPVFCGLPADAYLSGNMVEKIGLQTYNQLPSEKKQASIHTPFAQFAVLGLMKKYPCNADAANNYREENYDARH